MNASLCSLLIAAVLATSVNAHGQMTSPTYRPVTAKFLADSGALKNAGEQELQYAPVENLSQRKQKDFPEAATFDMMNGCRGMVYEAGGPVTALKPGQELPVKWIIQAPHPGYAEFSIVKPKTGAGGKIMYEKAVLLKRIEDFAKNGGEGGDTVTIPTDITGCEKAGDCALQMYWHSDIANQTYPTCADITISGSGAGTGGSSTTTKAPSTGTKAPSKTPTVTTKAPSTGGNTKTPKPTTAAPATTEPPANDADEDCEDELPIAGEEDCDDDLDIADTPAPATGGSDEYPDEYATPAPASGGEVGGEADADEDCEDELPIAGEEDCDDELEIPDTQAPAAATTKAPKATKAPKKTKAPKTPKPSKTKKTKEAVRTSDLGFEELSADDDVAAAVSL